MAVYLDYNQGYYMRSVQKSRTPLFNEGDLIRLKESFIEKVMNHDKVFALYVELGAPRDWIVNLCRQNPMRITNIEQDANNDYVVTFHTDPRDVVWQQEWFELVAHNNFEEVEEEDLFAI